MTINQATGAAPTTARGNTPNRTLIFEDGGGFQADLLAHYWLNNRSIENRTLVTLDINDYYRWDPTKTYGPTTSPFMVSWNTARHRHPRSQHPAPRRRRPLLWGLL